MPTPILTTKLYIPSIRSEIVSRPRLSEKLNTGLHRKLTLISAPAGFGKTTIVSEWAVDSKLPVAWLSLDDGENDPTRFIVYLVAAIRTIAPDFGNDVMGMLQSPQPPPVDSILTTILNEISGIQNDFILILDDYHLIDAKKVDAILTFLLQHMPPQMHLVIVTREDPDLPLARVRSRGQLTELRAADLRFVHSESVDFLNQVMGVDLSTDDVIALEARTEGWIAGLKLAAISMQGNKDYPGFIKSFTGSHRFVVDYLLEEVLQQQPANIKKFLLYTSNLDRLCGPLCDAVISDPTICGKETLIYLQQANLFIIALDDERNWYRYHHLFADLLKQRVKQDSNDISVEEIHIRASIWYEKNGYEIDAFQHATIANDIDRAERLMDGEWMPLHLRGIVAPVFNWLNQLPTDVLNTRPLLRVTYASTLLVMGKENRAEQELETIEKILEGLEQNKKNKDLIGRIAAMRGTIAVIRDQVETIVHQAQRALEYLHPDNLAFRASTTFKLGFAYQRQGKRTEAKQMHKEVISICQETGNAIVGALAMIGLGIIQESDTQLKLAAQTFGRCLQLFEGQTLPFAFEVHLGLASIHYQWNDLAIAQDQVEKSIQLAELLEKDTRVMGIRVLFARIKFSQGDMDGASLMLADAAQAVSRNQFSFLMPDVIEMQIRILLHKGNLEAAAELVDAYDFPLGHARVAMAKGETQEALSVLDTYQKKMAAKGWKIEQLKAMVLQTIALYMAGEKEKALQSLIDVQAMTEPEGYIRILIDEGKPMAKLLAESIARTGKPDYIRKLLAAMEIEACIDEEKARFKSVLSHQTLVEPLSQRELEVLHLIAQGLSNHEICERLFVALSTVKGHNRNIFGKLQVQRRTEAVARARELGLLKPLGTG